MQKTLDVFQDINMPMTIQNFKNVDKTVNKKGKCKEIVETPEQPGPGVVNAVARLSHTTEALSVIWVQREWEIFRVMIPRAWLSLLSQSICSLAQAANCSSIGNEMAAIASQASRSAVAACACCGLRPTGKSTGHISFPDTNCQRPLVRRKAFI